MHIISFEAVNYKRLKAIRITPDGNVIQLVGKNGQGKTSVLDAIWSALAGGSASRKIKQPIRKGAKEASVRLDLGEYIVTKVWTKDGPGELTVQSPRGATYGSPQKVIDALVGPLAFDPLAFMNLDAPKQVATLIDMLGDSLGFDPVKLDKEYDEAVALRRDANRDVKTAEAQLAGMQEVPAETPDEEQSATELMQEYEQARSHNDEIDFTARDMHTAVTGIKVAEERIAELQRGIVIMKEALGVTEAKFIALGDPTDLDEIRDRIAAVDTVNAAVHKKKERADAAAKLSVLQSKAQGFDDEVKAIAKTKADGLAAAKFPVEGLSFDSDGVTLNGIRLEGASGREQLIVSTKLAMAMNPELRVLRIDKAEALDSDGLKIIADLADSDDYQIWMSRVTEDESEGIVIEDGEVKEA